MINYPDLPVTWPLDRADDSGQLQILALNRISASVAMLDLRMKQRSYSSAPSPDNPSTSVNASLSASTWKPVFFRKVLVFTNAKRCFFVEKDPYKRSREARSEPMTAAHFLKTNFDSKVLVHGLAVNYVLVEHCFRRCRQRQFEKCSVLVWWIFCMAFWRRESLTSRRIQWSIHWSIFFIGLLQYLTTWLNSNTCFL